MKDFLLAVSGWIFATVAVFDIMTFLLEWPLQVGPLYLSHEYALPIGIVLVLLSFGCFVSSMGPSHQ